MNTHDLNYVGPAGVPCAHYEIAPNRVACGYNVLKPPIGEQHKFVRTVRAITCTACRVVVEQSKR